MLDAAGVEYEAVAADVDENSVKAILSDAGDIAAELAGMKADDVSGRRPNDWVIGSDSIVKVAGHIFNKPADRDQAGEHLRFFSGKPMLLTSAVALARRGVVDWRHVESATL